MKQLVIGLVLSLIASVSSAQIVYSEHGSRGDLLKLANTSLNSPVQLYTTARNGYIRDPDLSPLGNKVAFIDSGVLRIISYTNSGSVTSNIVLDNGRLTTHPDFSPDGSKVIYSILLADNNTREIRIRDLSGNLLMAYQVPEGAGHFNFINNNEFVYTSFLWSLYDNSAVRGYVYQLRHVILDGSHNVLADNLLLDSRNESFGEINSIEYSSASHSLIMGAEDKIALGGKRQVMELDLASLIYVRLAEGERAELSADQSEVIYRKYVAGKKGGYLVNKYNLNTNLESSVKPIGIEYEYFAW